MADKQGLPLLLEALRKTNVLCLPMGAFVATLRVYRQGMKSCPGLCSAAGMPLSSRRTLAMGSPSQSRVS